MNIETLYKEVLATLTNKGKIRPISEELLSITDNGERTLYVYYLLRGLNVFPNITEVKKTEEVSTYYRNRGNKYFNKSEDYKAWQYYNLSLMHAPSHSDSYALGISNRSAVFFCMKKYNECLKDIDHLLSVEYPKRLNNKLLKRQTACKEALAEKGINNICNDDSHINNILEMKGPRNPQYLCASNKLEVEWSIQMGRHVIAKENIKVGEVLVQEDPYLALLLKDQYLFGCSYCLSRDLNLLPCNKCCYALYCSTECKDKAWKEYHEVECPIMAILVSMQFTKLELLALRTVIKARTDHENWQSLYSTIANAEKNVNSQYRGMVKVNDKWIFDSKHYTCIHTLESNVDKRSISDIFQKALSAAVFLKLLEVGTGFIDFEDVNFDEREKIRRCVAGLLLLHIMTSPTNMHGISSNLENSEGKYITEVNLASAPYAFHSLINHSCSPNVVRISQLGSSRMTLFALRPIKKGTQLFDNYGPHHAIENRTGRQEALRFQYKFNCWCEACIHDWPTYHSLSLIKNLPIEIKLRLQELLNQDSIAKLENGDRDIASQLFKPLCELAQGLDKYAPCKELADCQESLKQCLVILEGVIPHGYSQLVPWNAIPSIQ